MENKYTTENSSNTASSSNTHNRVTRNASYSLKDLHGQPALDNREEFEIVNADGAGSLGIVATLFYRTSTTRTADLTEIVDSGLSIGPSIPEMALFEFVRVINHIMVPWKKGPRLVHSCLDALVNPKVMDVMLPRLDNLRVTELARHEDVWAFQEKWGIEVCIQENNVFRRYKRLAVFDMDSTLIQQEVIDEMAEYAGVKEKVSAITETAMNGELDFEESLRQRVALLKGVPATVFESLKSKITFTPGARELTRVLKNLGYKMAVLSGGFLPLANYVKEELGLDYAYANTLAVSDDGTYLTGGIVGDIVHAERKAELLMQIAAENSIPLEQVIAIGDGANDLVMMAKAGLGIAFNAKPAVQLRAPCRLNSETLQDVLYLLGITKLEQEAILST